VTAVYKTQYLVVYFRSKKSNAVQSCTSVYFQSQMYS